MHYYREVIERKPEEFKISCLRDICALFPATRNPLYAGFGNKINVSRRFPYMRCQPSFRRTLYYFGDKQFNELKKKRKT